MALSDYLSEVKSVWGGTRRTIFTPSMRRYADVLFIPDGFESPGLYHTNGDALLASQTHLLPENTTNTPIERDRLWALFSSAEQIDTPVIYAGSVLNHYGHALLSSLNRYWFMTLRKPDRPIIAHGPPPFSLPYMAFWLSHCGLGPDDFRPITSPVRLKDVALVQPSFEELRQANDIFAKLCHNITKSAGVVVGVSKHLRPTYISKSRIQQGVSRFVNEDEIDREMERLGAEIIYPEALPLEKQIEIFCNASSIIGTACSALHTALFVPGGCRITALTYQNIIHGNYLLVDKISRSRSKYLYAPSQQVQSQDGFHLTFRLDDPKRVAQSLFVAAT